MTHLEDKEVTMAEFFSPASVARLHAKIKAQNAPPKAHKVHIVDEIEKIVIVASMIWMGVVTFGVCFQLLAKGAL